MQHQETPGLQETGGHMEQKMKAKWKRCMIHNLLFEVKKPEERCPWCQLDEVVGKLHKASQTNLFDSSGKSGSQLAKEGIERSEAGANAKIPGWSVMALDIIRITATEQEFLISDSCREVGVRLGLPEPHNPSAWGGVMRRAINVGYIEKTEKTIPSTRPVAHRILRPVYRSLIWRRR